MDVTIDLARADCERLLQKFPPELPVCVFFGTGRISTAEWRTSISMRVTSDLQRCIDAECNDYVVKSFTAKDLRKEFRLCRL